MSEIYLKEMLEHRKGSDAVSMVKTRRRLLDRNGKFAPEKVRQLTRSQADVELAQLRQRFAWDDDISPRQLSDRLKILASCGFYSVSHKAEYLIRYLPLRAQLLHVRQEGELQEDLWELVCFSLVDQRAYVLNSDFWGRLNGVTLRTWKKELKEFRRRYPELAAACGTTLEEIEERVDELVPLANSVKSDKDSQPIMERLIEREERRVHRQQQQGEVYSGGGENGYWRMILIAIFVVSGLVRGFTNNTNTLSKEASAQRARNDAFILERTRLEAEETKRRTEQGDNSSASQLQRRTVRPPLSSSVNETTRLHQEMLQKRFKEIRTPQNQPPGNITIPAQPGQAIPPFGNTSPQGIPPSVSAPSGFSPGTRGPLNP